MTYTLSILAFKEKVQSGAKCQAIAKKSRKNPIKAGDKLNLCWKQRSPECEKLGEAICSRATPIEISKNRLVLPYVSSGMFNVLNAFAIADGFDNWNQLIEFFEETYGLPFKGILIEWDLLDKMAINLLDQNKLDKLENKKIIGHYPVIFLEELVLELIGHKFAELDNKLKESEFKIDTLQAQVDGFIESKNL